MCIPIKLLSLRSKQKQVMLAKAPSTLVKLPVSSYLEEKYVMYYML